MSLRHAISDPWKFPLAALAAGTLVIVALYGSAALAAVRVWTASSTYQTLYFVLPAAVYLAWDRRHSALALAPRPDIRLGLLVALLFGLIGLVADAVGAMIGQQIALVGTMQALFLGILGWRVCRALLLPLIFLWLLVPVGDFLLPTLQNLTTAATVAGAGLLGIPAGSEGTLIRVPSGLYRVVEECSALDFLIGSLVMSLFYAGLIFARPVKLAAYVGAALALAVFANWFRTITVIAITHYSEGDIDLAADHTIYGWSVFLAATVALMWGGYRFRDPPRAPSPGQADFGPSPPLRVLAAFGAILIAAAAAPVYGNLNRPAPMPASQSLALCLPPTIGAWHAVETGGGWRPPVGGAQFSRQQRYSDGGIVVDLYVAYRMRQSQGAELIGSGNRLADDRKWVRFPETPTRIRVAGRDIRANTTELRRKGQRRIVWHWYWVDGAYTGDRIRAKLRQARAELLGGERRAALIAVSAATVKNRAGARAALRRFLIGGGALSSVLESGGRGPAARC